VQVDVLERLQACPGVIALEDVFEDTENVMIVTELCSGGDLQAFSEVRGASMPLVVWHVA
jgi:serine/threonine protein kinase